MDAPRIDRLARAVAGATADGLDRTILGYAALAALIADQPATDTERVVGVARLGPAEFVAACRRHGGALRRIGSQVATCTIAGLSSTCNFRTGECVDVVPASSAAADPLFAAAPLAQAG